LAGALFFPIPRKGFSGGFMDERILIQNTAFLLRHSKEIIKNYDALYRETGKKYNIFKIARVSDKERIICRVIADLLNPKGSHYKDDLYLKIFWDIVSEKIENCPKLNTLNAVVTTEYTIEANRRIDIVIEDGSIFVPIEVKILAGEQEDQIKDYAQYFQKKNREKYIPVLYLTLNGKSSRTAGNNKYINISFHKDILPWLEKCSKTNETENTPPVREIIKQLIEAIRVILGYSEDEEMRKEILDLIIQSDETIYAAAEIENALNAIDGEKREIYKTVILKKVQEQFPGTELCEENDWCAISIPIKNDAYVLSVNYDWKKIAVEADGVKKMPSSVKTNIEKIMTGLIDASDVDFDSNWRVEKNIILYPKIEITDKGIYPDLALYRKYKKNPEEAANHIITIASELEKI
jgi:hypothetical protein